MPLSTEQLLPFKTLCDLQIFSTLSVIALEKIFLSVFMSVMGLVLSMFFSQSEVLGIDMMFALFHSFGVCPSIRILLKSSVID